MKSLIGGVVGLVLVIGLAWGSRATWRPAGSEAGLIRLELRARPERIERCRRLSDEELAGVPAHMRERIQCEGHTARYQLLITIDGSVVAERQIGGGGALSDRPISLLEDFRVAPGHRALLVRITRIDSAQAVTAPADDSSSTERERRMAETRERARREALPATVVLDTSLAIGPGQVVLVSYRPEQRQLVLPFGAAPR